MDYPDYQELMPGARACMTEFVNVTKQDKVLIITDKPVIAEALAEAAKEIGAEVLVCFLPHVLRPVRKLSEPLKSLILNATVVFSPFDVKPEEFPFRKDMVGLASDGDGRKIAHMPSVTTAMFSTGGMLALSSEEMHEMKTLTESLAMLLSATKTATIRSSVYSDTNLSLQLGGWSRSGIVSTGHIMKGSWGDLPSGEAFVLPERGTANGTIVIDMAISGIPSTELPITLQVTNGIVERDSVTRGRTFEGLLDKYTSDDARMVCEFGIGTNPKPSYRLELIEIEKIHGTIHIAIGNNAVFGGDIKADVPHTDMVIKKPTVTVNNLQSNDTVKIIEHGNVKKDRINAFFKICYTSFSAVVGSGSAIIRVAPDIEVEDDGSKMYRCWKDYRGHRFRLPVGDDNTANKVRDLWPCISRKSGRSVQDILTTFTKKFGGDTKLPCQLLNVLKQFGTIEITEPMAGPERL